MNLLLIKTVSRIYLFLQWDSQVILVLILLHRNAKEKVTVTVVIVAVVALGKGSVDLIDV
jgi:hypothetical protein